MAEYANEFPYVDFILSSKFSFMDYILPALYTSPLWLVVMYFANGYKVELQVKSFRHLQRIIFVCLVGIAIYIVTFFFLRMELFSRLIFVMIFMFSVLLIFNSHIVINTIAKHFYKRGIGTFPTLIIGTTREAQKLIGLLKENNSIHQPVAILDGYGTKLKEISDVPVLGKLNIFEDTIKKHKIEQIIQTDNLEQTINILNFALQNNLKYAMLPTLLGVHGKGSKVEEVEGVPVVRVE